MSQIIPGFSLIRFVKAEDTFVIENYYGKWEKKIIVTVG